MIGKGAQYLTAAGFGRYRITAASLGSLDMLSWLRWLKGSAIQAIMDAFGVDGPAVIAATNDYLNGIAASDYAKATALAGFINEDPMMVCSLPLTISITMPKRWLVGDGKAYIKTNIVFGSGFHTKIRLRTKNTLSSTYMIGAHNASEPYGRNGFGVYQGQWQVGYSTNSQARTVARNTEYLFEGCNKPGNIYMKVDGTTIFTSSNSDTSRSSLPICLFTYSVGTEVWGVSPLDFDFNEIECDDDNTAAKFVPCKHKVNGVLECGALDLESLNWWGNYNTEGSFTIPDISYTPTP
jgi:hypothetical protein